MEWSEPTRIQNNLKRRIWASAVVLLLLSIAIVFVGQVLWRQTPGGPLIPIPGSPGCNLQLSVELDKSIYLPGEVVTVTAMLLVHGDCIWVTKTGRPYGDFIIFIERVDSQGNVTQLANEDTFYLSNLSRMLMRIDAKHPFRESFPLDYWFHNAIAHSEMYDTSQAGTYMLKFVLLSELEPGRIPSNEVTFTRLP